MMDMAYWALDLRLPTTCQAEGSPLSPDTCPQWLTAEWDHPANDWRPAVKVAWYDGGKTGKPTLCNFDYSGALIENNLLALVAYRVGQPLEWDASNLKATNCPDADRYIRKEYRVGWVLNG
jgi:hypothetical protein